MRVVDTSAWVEWLVDSDLGREVGREMPAQELWIVPTIVQFELSRWLTREVSEEAAGSAIAGEAASTLPKAAADATLALVGLGYGRPQALAAVSRALAALGAEASTAALIKAGLKELAQ